MLRKLPPLQLSVADEEKVDAALKVVQRHWEREAATYLGERTNQDVLDAIFAKDEAEKRLGRWLPARVSTRSLEWEIAKEAWEVTS